MSAPPVTHLQQPEQLTTLEVPGTGMPAPPAAYLQQLTTAGTPGTGMPGPSAIHQPTCSFK
ncbi:hypothetical protein GBF38_012784, partial [Nibea albiflora]